MLTYADALKIVKETVSPLPSQIQPLTTAIGQVIAKPVCARWDMPRWDNSAMDGFAVSSQALDSTAGLDIVGSSFAGHPYNKTLQRNEAIQITTGAPLPCGADTVIPVEDTSVNDNCLSWTGTIRAKQHVRYQGEEYCEGERLVNAGTVVDAGTIGLLTGAGITEVAVYPRPRVAIFSTGDELLNPGQDPGPGQIINSNLQYLQARLQECGCTVLPLGIGADQRDNLGLIYKQAKEADLIVSTGGVSVGEKDLVQQTLLDNGFERKFWKVAIKPGKPLLFGLLNHKPCFGLPGNPAATASTFELFVLPALRILAGHGTTDRKMTARLKHGVKAGGSRHAFLWSRCEWQGDGYHVEVPQRQGSGQTRSIQGANALLSLAVGSPDLKTGDKVEIFPLYSL
ncbi:molybdopterin molybdotransferase [Desulfuromusa kysingii]|uniref:Molybdopterin molybdenumtransferase n=1 Tax=Desulfuromusa kysingii TaxID=37625 RepID=A0A1H4DQM3_9BACT|nr:gephyrin-like molybdotransferase Glp [Desulfuromusa kysingii]SEA75055.1 molybdopterin molybdotransferase [Desulfuromusa kysingii]